MKSAWAITQQRSQYHFDNSIIDPRWDTVTGLGWIDPEAWRDDIDTIIQHSRPATWDTRGYKEKDRAIASAVATTRGTIKQDAVRIDKECKLDPEVVPLLNNLARDPTKAKP